jgi:hypothetical protein
MPRIVLLCLLTACALAPAAAHAQVEAPTEDISPARAGGASPAPTTTSAPSRSTTPKTTSSRSLYPVAVGIGDQNVAMFDNPLFGDLGIRKVRYFVKWDTIDRPGELAITDAWVNRAVALRLQVLMHISSSDLTNLKQAKLPSVREYKEKVGALIDRYRPLGIRTWGAMNEANHASQPTWNNPRRAAQYFLALRQMCKRCTILALDVLDQRGVDRYIRRFYAALGRRRSLAKFVGIHNYSDTNRRRDSGTRLIIRTVKRLNPRAQFWLTETGGVAKFGRSFPCDPAKPERAEQRQARAVDFMFTLTRRFSADVRRLYVYNFTGDDCQGRFDSGLVRRNGTARPAYDVVKRRITRFKR